MDSVASRILYRSGDAPFRLSPTQAFWLIVGPAIAYLFPYLGQRLARATLGRVEAQHLFDQWILPELGPIEIPTFLLLVCSGVWAIRLAVTRRNELGRLASVALQMFGIGLLLVAGEEASWGQWFFRFEPPATIAQINHQGELNLHNIILQGKTELMRIAFGVFGLGIVFVAPRIPALASVRAPLVLAPWFLMMTLLPLWELITDFVVILPRVDGFMRSKLFSESQELVIAASALVYVALIARRLSYGGGWSSHSVPNARYQHN